MKKDLTRQQIHLNLPKKLLSELKAEAKEKRWSITTLIVDLIENSLKR